MISLLQMTLTVLDDLQVGRSAGRLVGRSICSVYQVLYFLIQSKVHAYLERLSTQTGLRTVKDMATAWVVTLKVASMSGLDLLYRCEFRKIFMFFTVLGT